MKLLKTTGIEIEKYCEDQFAFKLPSELTANRTHKFYSKITGFKMRTNKC